MGSSSNSTRSLTYGGYTGDRTNVIDYVQIATLGNAIDFGDIATAQYGCNAFASSTRGVSFGGTPVTGLTNVIEFVTIASTGNATDFGDMQNQRRFPGGASNSHGGI
jgi:hypothetical protein